MELLEKFKSVQEKARRAQRAASQRQVDQDGVLRTGLQNPSLTAALSAAATSDQGRSGRDRAAGGSGDLSRVSSGVGGGTGAGGAGVGAGPTQLMR